MQCSCNRDPRLWHVVMPPFRVLSKTEATAHPELGGYQEEGIPADKNWFFTNNPEDREFIDILVLITDNLFQLRHCLSEVI